MDFHKYSFSKLAWKKWKWDVLRGYRNLSRHATWHQRSYNSTGWDFDSTIKFNASTGEDKEHCEWFYLWCLWYRSRFRHKASWLHSFLSFFFPRPASCSRQFTPNGSNFGWHFTAAWYTKKKKWSHEVGLDPRRGYSQKNWLGVCGPLAQNHYPIYDQNLRNTLPYSLPDQKFETQFMTRPAHQNHVSDLHFNYFRSSKP